jgi:hypothetical protein
VTHELDPDGLSRLYSGDGHQKTRASTSRGASIKIFDYIEIDGSGSGS